MNALQLQLLWPKASPPCLAGRVQQAALLQVGWAGTSWPDCVVQT